MGGLDILLFLSSFSSAESFPDPRPTGLSTKLQLSPHFESSFLPGKHPVRLLLCGLAAGPTCTEWGFWWSRHGGGWPSTCAAQEAPALQAHLPSSESFSSWQNASGSQNVLLPAFSWPLGIGPAAPGSMGDKDWVLRVTDALYSWAGHACPKRTHRDLPQRRHSAWRPPQPRGSCLPSALLPHT